MEVRSAFPSSLFLSLSIPGWFPLPHPSFFSPPGSIGCIMGEVLTGKPLFRADTDIAQLEAIFKVRMREDGQRIRKI